MKLSEFKKMWEDDGFKFARQDKKTCNGADWYLYNVNLPYGSSDYGRHMAMILKVDRKTREVLKHDMKNTQNRMSRDKPAPWTKEIQDWFDKHVGRY